MPNVIVNEQWYVGGALTDLDTPAVLCDGTGTLGLYDNTASSNVVAANTAMTRLSTGTYQYTYTGGTAGHTYTAYRKCTYQGAVYILPQTIVIPPAASAPYSLTYGYANLVNAVGLAFFGLRPTVTDVISDGIASAAQASDILKAIQDGLLFVYNSHRWSFLRPVVSFSTLPAYGTGTIKVDVSGNVTLTGGTFPSYAASSFGQVQISASVPPTFYGGTWSVASYNSPTSLTLANYTGPALTTGVAYNLIFNHYAIATGCDTYEEELTELSSGWNHRRTLAKVDELEVRRRLQHDPTPRRPECYAVSTIQFDPTAGSARYVTFWPPPDIVRTFQVKAILRPTMLDSVNNQPIGIEILAPVFMESCLAAGERNIDQQDGTHSDAVHNRALQPLLALAIQRDKENAAPDTLGVDDGDGRYEHHGHRPYRQSSIWWNNGGYVGWL